MNGEWDQMQEKTWQKEHSSRRGGGVSIGSIMTHGYTMRYYEIYTSTIAYRNFYFFLMQLETNGSDFLNPCFFQPYPSSKRLYPRSSFRGSSWIWISINDEILGSPIWGVSKNGTPKSYGFSSFAFLKLPFWRDILPTFTHTQEISWPIQVLADLPSQFFSHPADQWPCNRDRLIGGTDSIFMYSLCNCKA